MKKINYTLILMLLFLSASCYEDKGNYDYYPINEVGISGIEKEYDIERWDTLNIAVDLNNSLKDNKAAQYAWYLNGNKISDTKDLKYEVSEKAQKYAARFEVTVPEDDGVRFFFDFELNVHSQYSEGLMLLSQCGDHPEISFYNTLSNPKKKTVRDMFLLENKKSLTGKPLRIEQPDQWSYGGVLFVHTSDGIYQLDPVLCKLMKTYKNDAFSEKGKTFNMVFSTFEGSEPDFGASIGTDGQIYPKLARQDRFVPGSLKPINIEKSSEQMDYQLSPLALSSRDATLGYDEKSGHFLYFYSSWDIPSYDENQYDIVRVSKYQIGLPWVFWGRTMDDSKFASLFFDKVTKQAKLIPSHSRTGYTKGKDSIVVLNNHYLDADSKFALNSGSNLLYYTNGGNKIYTINISDPDRNFVSIEFPVALPADCKITMLKVSYNNLDLLVGVDSGRNEKYNGDVYRINGTDGTIIETYSRFGGTPVDVVEKAVVEFEL